MILTNDELDKIENIEDKLGISITTLFKALTTGYWMISEIDGKPICLKNGNNTFKHSLHYWSLIDNENVPEFYIDTVEIYDDRDSYVKTKDYGKTWALTKEELEKESLN